MSRKLGEQLVSEGVLKPDLLARALERQKATGHKLGECLVRLGLDETPVLRVLAQELKTRFVSTVKLAQAKIEPSLIEKIPVRLAEGFDFVPLRLDEAGVLYVAIAEPQRQRAIEEIARTVGVKQVLPFVAVRRSIRAAIRKHYYADHQAFEHMSDDEACPHCGAPVVEDDFQCARCELLLVRSPEELQERDNVSLVRALITAPERKSTAEVPASPHLDKTRASGYAHDPARSKLVPIIIGGLLAFVEKPLNPFEAYVLSFVDGRTTLSDIARVTNLSEVELHAIFESLCEREITELTAGPGKPAPAEKAAPDVRGAKPEAKAASTPAPARRQPSPVPTAAPGPEVAPVKEASQSPGGAQPRAVSADPSDGVIQRAVQLERSGKIEEAIEVLEQGISKLPKPAPLYNRLGMILLNQRKDYTRASKLFQKAADLDPDNNTYMMNLYTVLSLTVDETNAGKKAKRK
jgi:type IV pilus assembly protein PilB